jgi:histone-lysine N-methyltransferase SETD1
MDRRRVFVYAGKGIGVGEEMTYDYQFPYGEKLITCKCGTPACRGTLNITAAEAEK